MSCGRPWRGGDDRLASNRRGFPGQIPIARFPARQERARQPEHRRRPEDAADSVVPFRTRMNERVPKKAASTTP